MCVILAMESRFEGSSVFCELGHGGRCGRVVVVTPRVTTAFSQHESLVQAAYIYISIRVHLIASTTSK